MHREYRDCDIIFDLLPLYLDGKTQSASNAYIIAHLEKCENCQENLSLMQADFGKFSVKEKVEVPKGISKSKKWLILVLGLYGLGLVAVIIWLFCAVALPVL